jgi:hypothetical protein
LYVLTKEGGFNGKFIRPVLFDHTYAVLKDLFQLERVPFYFLKLQHAQLQQGHLIPADVDHSETHDRGSGVNAQYHPVRAQLLSLLGLENTPKRSVYKGISLCIKLLIVAASCWYIYTKVFHRHDLDDLRNIVAGSLSSSGTLFVLIVLVLVPLNWGIEAVKWRMLVRPLSALSFAASFRAVLTGVAVSIITPNRAGEFAGRIFSLQKSDRLKAAWLTFAGSAMQLFVTLLAASISFLFLRWQGLHGEAGRASAGELVVPLVGLIAVCCTVLFVLLLLLVPLLIRNSGSSKRRWIASLEALSRIGKRVMLAVLFLSVLRYCVFFLQFHLLLFSFGSGADLHDHFLLIPLTFFATSVIPSVALSELAVRGSAALLLFSAVTDAGGPVLAASLVLWCVNVALPALAGCFFVFRLKFFSGE